MHRVDWHLSERMEDLIYGLILNAIATSTGFCAPGNGIGACMFTSHYRTVS